MLVSWASQNLIPEGDMSKYKDGNFVQINRDIFKQDYHHKTVYIYIVLSELEHRFTGENEDFFFRALSDLAKDCKMNRTTIVKYRQKLIDDGWIHTWRMHYEDKKTGKRSEKHVTAYEVLR